MRSKSSWAIPEVDPGNPRTRSSKILRMNALECLATLAQDECARAAVFTPARSLGVMRALGAVLGAAAGPELPEGDQVSVTSLGLRDF